MSDPVAVPDPAGRGTTGWRRELGLPQVVCIAAGAMTNSGIFVLPGIAHAQADPAVILFSPDAVPRRRWFLRRIPERACRV
jgi:hypothetical protein